MNLNYFGDSYDIVKKSMIVWLKEFGSWTAHPMFTHKIESATADAFSSFLGAPLISTEVLTSKVNREEYFSCCESVDNLFLDPDTGVRLEPLNGLRSVNYIFARELLSLIHARPKALSLVFDQSYSRGSQRKPDIQAKLILFKSEGAHGFAYSSHAPFLVLSADPRLADRAHRRLLEVSGLPQSRLVKVSDS